MCLMQNTSYFASSYSFDSGFGFLTICFASFAYRGTHHILRVDSFFFLHLLQITPTACLPQTPFSTQFADTVAAAWCCSPHLATQQPTTLPHPPNSLAVKPTHRPNPLRPPCPRRWRQERPPGAGPRHPEHLELGALIRPAMVPPVDPCCRRPSASLHAPAYQSWATTQAAYVLESKTGQ
jgi:hypothetical protein